MPAETPHPSRVLIVEDDVALADLVASILRGEGCAVTVCHDGKEGLEAVTSGDFDLVLTDYRLPGMGGMELLERVHDWNARIPVIMMTSFGNSDTVIGASRRGVFEYLVKPFDMEQLIEAAGNALRASKLMFKPVELGHEGKGTTPIIGSCLAMREVFKEIGRVAPTNASVLIRGETGTGKELMARAIFQHSERSAQPFVAVNCGAIPETLLESELFGHRKGAFTGADMNRTGRLEQADGGTLFLDEIGDMPLATQIKLLRALQEKTIQPLGSSQNLKVDVRVLAATHQNLEALIAEGRFREDLYYRLNTIVLQVPPLRERGEDVVEFANFFLRKVAAEFKIEAASFDKSVLSRLRQGAWPGNVRHLENVVARAVLRARGRALAVEDLEAILEDDASPPPAPGSGDATVPLRIKVRAALKLAKAAGKGNIHAEFVSELESVMIREALDLSGNRVGKAADWLGISRVTLRQRIKALGLGGGDG